MIKATQHNLKKFETLFKEANIRIRYGKGNFQAGYCILDEQNQIIVNKMYSIEAKIGILTDLLRKKTIDTHRLSDPSRKLYESITDSKVNTDSPEEEAIQNESNAATAAASTEEE